MLVSNFASILEMMIKSGKKLNDLAVLLRRDVDPATVVQAIEFLREEEAFEGVVRLLSSCYNETNGTVKKAIEGFMNDIKDKSLRAEVMSEIRKGWDQATIRMLVSSCWQSGMDYSEFTRDFAEIFISGDYATSIECFTAIEESAPELSSNKKEELIELLDNHTYPKTEPKETLRLELISVLKR